jgi:HK97 gp10 family phage protein
VSVFADGPPLLRLALGRGKFAKTQYAMTSLDKVIAQLKELPKEISLKHQATALRKAAKPGEEALRQQVAAIGQVTGNLLASVTRKVAKYTNNRQRLPVTVVVIGFRRPVNSKSQKSATPAFQGGTVMKGPNRAYHSHLVEFGTRPRTPGIKSVVRSKKRVVLGGRIRTIVQRENKQTEAANRGVLSSLKSRGPFTGGGRGLYPKDFIATGTVAGSPPRHPLRNAFNQSKGQMQSVLDIEMRKALTRAVKEYQRKYGDLGGQ